MTLNAVIFDLGGTLIYHPRETDELIGLGYRAMTDYLAGEGFDVRLNDVARIASELYGAYEFFAEKSFVEVNAETLYSAILYQLGIADYSNEGLIIGTINSFYKAFVDDFQIFDDVRGVLGRLREKGLKTGLLTNNHSIDFHLRLLQKFQLEEVFDSVVVSSKVGIRKPHTGIFLHCLQTLGAGKDTSIFVGDSLSHDVMGAQNAGIKCIWVKRENCEEVPVKPDWTVESIKQAEEVILSLLSF